MDINKASNEESQLEYLLLHCCSLLPLGRAIDVLVLLLFGAALMCLYGATVKQVLDLIDAGLLAIPGFHDQSMSLVNSVIQVL